MTFPRHTLPSFEPYRVKTVEPIHRSTPEQRRRWLKDAEYSLFRIPAERVMIDLLTDSGTGALSADQWSAMMRGNESYAGSTSYQRLVESVQKVTGIGNVLPTYQGRVSERILVEAVIGKPHAGRGMIVPNNAHFDTTRCMIEQSGAEAFNLLAHSGDDSASLAHFKGDIDLQKLESLLKDRGEDVPLVMLTLTCNSNGGQPVSLANIRAVRKLCDRHGKALFFDACRFAENAMLIKQREASEMRRSIMEIVREMFDLCDGAELSARKDLLSNTGGLLLIRDENLFRKACNLSVLTEGFGVSYGGLAARDLECIAVGLQEAIDERHLSQRIGSIQQLGERLIEGGVGIVQPVGGHAVFIDAEEFCPHIPRDSSPAHSLACALYEHAGIRAIRIGSVLNNQRTGEPMELVRLAIPRRTYMQSHLDYVAAAVIDLKTRASQIHPVPIAPAAIGKMIEPEFAAA